MPAFDRQEAFTTMVTHLRQQGHRAIDQDTQMCLYRAPGGSKCAVGALIPDELYDHSAEDTTLEPAAGFGKFLPYDYALTALDFVFLRGAQGRLHDNLTNNGFEAQLEAAAASFAKDYDLNVPA